MSRRNHTKRRPQARRRADALPPLKRNPKLRVQLDEMVIPRGRCYFQSRNGKLRFAEGDVDKALAQAQRSREAKGLTSYAEQRAYACPAGGCGDWHLTSRSEYSPRGSA